MVMAGTDEMIDMNNFARLAMSFEGKSLPIKNIPGPEGVRGRNSDNTMIKEKLGWAPSISLHDGIKATHAWIKEQVLNIYIYRNVMFLVFVIEYS